MTSDLTTHLFWQVGRREPKLKYHHLDAGLKEKAMSLLI